MTITATAPPDGGYGWVIVVCFLIINSCLLPLTQCFGIIYGKQFSDMNITAAEISFLLHLNNSVMCSLGLFSGPLLKRFDFRQVSFMGSCLVCLGILATAFAKSYEALIVTVGIIIGAGQGILMPGMYIAVNSYFKRRLTLAISVQVTGASLTQIFMPQVCRFLLEEYDVQGTILILAGISLNAIPMAILLRPLKKPDPPPVQQTQSDHELESSEKGHVSERLLSPVYRETTVPAKNKQRRCAGIIKMLDLELFADRVYVIIIIGMGISFVSELNVILMTPFILDELAGFAKKDVATAMSVQASADIIGRLVIPIIAHRGGVPSKVMYIISLLGSSLGRTVLSIYYGEYYVVFLACAIVGLSKGIKAVFQSVIIPKHVSPDRLAAATGLNMISNGILSLILGPLIGWSHDISESYVYSLHVATALSLFCVALWTVDYLLSPKKPSQIEGP